MVVAVENYLPLLESLSHHVFGCVVFGTESLVRAQPLPVQVETRKGTSVVSYSDPVRVQHRNDLENEVFAQVASALIIRNEVLQSPLHHVTCV